MQNGRGGGRVLQKHPPLSFSLNLPAVHFTPGGPLRGSDRQGRAGSQIPSKGNSGANSDSSEWTRKGDKPTLSWGGADWRVPVSQPIPSTTIPPAIGGERGGTVLRPALVAPEQSRPESGRSAVCKLTSAAGSTSAHIPAPPPSPRPPRPFVLIPDSAAPAAAAKRTLHFRFRTAPPLSQNRRPSLLFAPPPPRPASSAASCPRGACWEPRGGRGLAAL